jgi:small multidrug resistance pump
MSWLLLAAAIASEVTGTFFLRASDGLRHRAWIAPLVVAYLASFALLALALDRGLAIGVAYGVWAATGVALTAVLSRLIFKEPLTRTMGLGIVCIAGGVLLIELGAHA